MSQRLGNSGGDFPGDSEKPGGGAGGTSALLRLIPRSENGAFSLSYTEVLSRRVPWPLRTPGQRPQAGPHPLSQTGVFWNFIISEKGGIWPRSKCCCDEEAFFSAPFFPEPLLGHPAGTPCVLIPPPSPLSLATPGQSMEGPGVLVWGARGQALPLNFLPASAPPVSEESKGSRAYARRAPNMPGTHQTCRAC